MKYAKLLVFGASGACGGWVVDLAKARGHHVTAFVRSTAGFTAPEGVQVVEGSVLDADAVDHVMGGQDAVVSCLGIRRKNPANPWSALASPANLTSGSARNIVRAMQKRGVQRIVAISAAGVGDSWDQMSAVMKFLVRRSNIAVSYRDMDQMEQLYRRSDLDTLMVRPVGLTNADKTSNRTGIVERFGLSSQMPRSDVAQWMLDAVERPAPFRHREEMIGWN